MSEHRHRAGSLKQRNKKHKGKSNVVNGKIESVRRQSIKAKEATGKQDRLNRMKQIRETKKQEVRYRQRIGNLD